MAYFNSAFQKVFWAASNAGGGATGYINDAGISSIDLLPSYGVGAVTFANQAAAGWPSVDTAPANGEPLTLISTSLYQNDKVGPFHGGYQETNKSKMINPKFISRFYRVDSNPGATHIIGVGATPNLDLSGADSTCCPTFYCNENYYMRFDLKGSPALRVLNHNAYHVSTGYTGCCDGPVPELVDPALVMSAWMNDVVMDPILFGANHGPSFAAQTSQRLVNVGVTNTCDDGATWDLYLPDNFTAGIAGVYFAADGTTLNATGTAFVNSLVPGLSGGAAATLGAISGGSGYADALGVAVTGGTGTGMTVDITTGLGVVTGVTINTAGTGYTPGDVVTITGGGGNATVTIATVVAFTFATVSPISSYVSAFTPATPNCCAGLVMESAFVETKFGDCTFMPSDHFEVEPLLIQASMLDETGDPCVFEQLCISDGMTPSGTGTQTVYPAIQFGKQVMGTGEQVLRDLILSESYGQNYFNKNDLRVREITQGYDITNAVDRNGLYTSYYLLHTVPRYNNPSGTFDNDQYLLRIPMDNADAGFEAFVLDWMANAGNPIGSAPIEVY
jgi:hypothetical protein